jgi:hypothetical protein
VVESWDLRPSSQCIFVSLRPSCFLLVKMCLCQVSLLSRWRPRYLGNNSVKTFPRQRRAVGGIVFYALRVVSKRSRRLLYFPELVITESTLNGSILRMLNRNSTKRLDLFVPFSLALLIRVLILLRYDHD